MPVTALRWIAVTTGDVTSFDLPRYPTETGIANMPDGEHYWQILAMHAPGVSWNELDLWDLFDWKSRAVQVGIFSTP